MRTAIPVIIFLGTPQAALIFYVEANGLPILDSLWVSRDPDYTWAAGWSTQAAHSLVAYAMSTFGPATLDDLVAGLTQHASWATLIPAIFGVSAQKFETDWHAYLMSDE